MKRVGMKAFGIGVIGIGLVFVGIQLARAEGGGGVDGKAVFEAKKCSMCHSIAGKGGKMGPDLSDIGSTQSEEWFEKFLKNPKSVKPDAKMAAMKGTDEEIHAVAGYLASLKAPK